MRTSQTCRQNINFWLIRSHVSQTSEITFFLRRIKYMSADEDLKSRDHDPHIFNLGLVWFLPNITWKIVQLRRCLWLLTPWMVKRVFFLTLSIQYQADKRWEQMKLSVKGLLVYISDIIKTIWQRVKALMFFFYYYYSSRHKDLIGIH